MGTPVRLFVVSTVPALQIPLARALDAEPGITVVGQARSSTQAIGRVPLLRPDVVFAGAHLRDPSSPDMCRRLIAMVPGLHVLMMGVYAPPELVADAVRAGASGVVPHTIEYDELVRAIQSAADGQMVMTAAAVHNMLAAQTGTAARLQTLTPVERDLFGLVGEGLSNAQIADELHLTEGTVRNYVSRMLQKLEVDRRTHVIALASKLKATQRSWYPPGVGHP